MDLRDNNHGFTIPLVLLLLLIIPLIGFTLFLTGMTEMRQVKLSESRISSFYKAKAITEALTAYLLSETFETEARIIELLAVEESTKVTIEKDNIVEEIPVTVRVYEEGYGITLEAICQDGYPSAKTVTQFLRLPDLLAVGDGGEIILFNGKNWIRADSCVNMDLHAVEYNGSLFVAVGDEGTIITSNNGLYWMLQESGTTRNLTGIAHNGDIFVVVGSHGTILSSVDGIIWEDYSTGLTPSSVNFSDIAWGQNLFVACGQVGNNGKIYSRQPGGNWIERHTYPNDLLSSVTWSDPRNRFFVAGSYNTRGQILYSPSGTSWDYFLSYISYSHLKDVACSQSGSVAVGENGWYWYSDDGSSWIEDKFVTVYETINRVIFHEKSDFSILDEDCFFAVGDSSRITYGYMIVNDTLKVFDITIPNLTYLNSIITMTPFQTGAWLIVQ